MRAFSAPRSSAYRLILDALEIEGIFYIVNKDGSISASMPTSTSSRPPSTTTVVIKVTVSR